MNDELDSLPALLQTTAGATVRGPDDWARWRDDLLEQFRRHVFGRAPVGRPVDQRLSWTTIDTAAVDGRATLRQGRVEFSNATGQRGRIDVTLFTPCAHRGCAAVFVLGSHRNPAERDLLATGRDGFWPVQAIVERGYATALWSFWDVDADVHDEFTGGVHGLFDAADQPRGSDAWGTIAAWSWGFARVIDLLQTEPTIDAQRIAIVGHSRGGKTALWAGAQDPRVALTISNQSGCTGAALARGKRGERIADITTRFPHWFCADYNRFAARESTLPVDQHQLLASIAPRLLYVSSASEDTWADPAAEFRATQLASPAWEVFGLTGLVGQQMPAVGEVLHAGRVGYHVREGRHALLPQDWCHFLDFARRWGWR